MKLFQQMLVATASLGLIAPIAAQASDVINLEGMNDYNRSKKSSTRLDSNTFVNEVNEELATLKGRVDGLEAQQNNFEAASFSDTTTMDGKAIFTVQSVDTEDGKEIRKAIKAQSDEYQIFSADYSQVELRVMAHLSGDKSLISALNNGEDIHTFTAKNIFNVDNDDMVLPEMRRIAKIVNFGIMYGAGPFRLSQELDIPFGEAKQIKDAYFQKYQGIEKYIENSKLQIKETKSVETLLGRRRAVWDSDSQNKIRRDAAERMAINMPIQGTAAEMIKLAMIKIHRQMNKENLKSKLIMQIHDELLLEVHQDEIDYISKMVIEHMRDAMKLDVPIEIDFGVGPSWYEAH